MNGRRSILKYISSLPVVSPLLKFSVTPKRRTIREYLALPSTETFVFEGLTFRHITEDISDGKCPYPGCPKERWKRQAVVCESPGKFDEGFYQVYDPGSKHMSDKESAAKHLIERFLTEN
jgi:hypothetical protein